MWLGAHEKTRKIKWSYLSTAYDKDGKCFGPIQKNVASF